MCGTCDIFGHCSSLRARQRSLANGSTALTVKPIWRSISPRVGTLGGEPWYQSRSSSSSAGPPPARPPAGALTHPPTCLPTSHTPHNSGEPKHPHASPPLHPGRSPASRRCAGGVEGRGGPRPWADIPPDAAATARPPGLRPLFPQSPLAPPATWRLLHPHGAGRGERACDGGPPSREGARGHPHGGEHPRRVPR